MSREPNFDPYTLFEALDRERVGYVVVGAFARVVHGSAETTRGLDVVPSLRKENLRRLGRALEYLGAKAGKAVEVECLQRLDAIAIRTGAGEVRMVATPWGTRGYDDLRIRASRENLGRGARLQVASLVDCVRMLEASERKVDLERLHRLQRLLEIERQLSLQRGRALER